eukprot:221939-Rhodomonas_salina.3
MLVCAPGTGIAMCLRARYAVSATDTAYAAASSPFSTPRHTSLQASTKSHYHALTRSSRSLVNYPIFLRTRYAVSGTDRLCYQVCASTALVLRRTTRIALRLLPRARRYRGSIVVTVGGLQRAY